MRRWELYRLLAEPVRLRLLALAAFDELTIGELAEILGESQPKVSRHVKPLKAEGLVAVRRQGTRTLVRFAEGLRADSVVADALEAGESLCQADGSFGRAASVVQARDAAVRSFFDAAPSPSSVDDVPAEVTAYIAMLGPLLSARRLAVDVGTGDGGLLDVLSPVFDGVIALDRSEARLRLAEQRVSTRGLSNVVLRRADYDEDGIRVEIQGRGGADAVFASRVLHHAPKPSSALSALAALSRPGGLVAVLDYETHGDEKLRDSQADVWLGFEAEELRSHACDAGLGQVSVRRLPHAWCGTGPDGHLRWQLLTARCPESSR